MTVNLYRGHDFCQIWIRDALLVTHRGSVGHRGTVTESRIPLGIEEEAEIQRVAHEVEREGFAVLRPEQQHQILVNFNVQGWEAEEITSFRDTVQDVLTELLSWTGNGRCTGYTLGTEGMTFWCSVVDQDLAIPTLINGLDEERLLHDEEQGTARLAIPNADQYIIVYPDEEQGQPLL